MNVRNQTDPNLQQLSIIASRAEWLALIDACDLEDAPLVDAWKEALYKVLVTGDNEARADTRQLQ